MNYLIKFQRTLRFYSEDGKTDLENSRVRSRRLKCLFCILIIWIIFLTLQKPLNVNAFMYSMIYLASYIHRFVHLSLIFLTEIGIMEQEQSCKWICIEVFRGFSTSFYFLLVHVGSVWWFHSLWQVGMYT